MGERAPPFKERSALTWKRTEGPAKGRAFSSSKSHCAESESREARLLTRHCVKPSQNR